MTLNTKLTITAPKITTKNTMSDEMPNPIPAPASLPDAPNAPLNARPAKNTMNEPRYADEEGELEIECFTCVPARLRARLVVRDQIEHERQE